MRIKLQFYLLVIMVLDLYSTPNVLIQLGMELYWIIAKNMPRLGLHWNLLKVGLSNKAVEECPFLVIRGYGPRDRYIPMKPIGNTFFKCLENFVNWPELKTI